MITAILDWLNTYESALSAIAALIVIGTVAAAVGRRWIMLNRTSDPVPDGSAPAGANASTAPSGPVTDKPSIAVLPFENTSGDPENEAAADGLTAEIIAGLSANRHLFVIARNSCFTYKGRRVDVRDVARELGVRYVLEGTVRRQGDRVRVSAQLVDASNGANTWSQRFDMAVDDIFELDDIVTAEIVAALIPELRRAEAKRARENPIGLDAWARVNAAWIDLQSDLANKDVVKKVIAEIEAVLKDEPDFALAHGVLAHAYSLAIEVGQEEAEETQTYRVQSLAHIQRAIALDSDDPAVRHLAGAAMANYGMSDDAQRAYEKALYLNPDYAPALGSLGVSLVYSGRMKEAITYMERALRLSPREPQAYHWQSHLGLAHNVLGAPARALDFAKAATERRTTVMGSVALLMAQSLLGHAQDAKAAAESLQQVLPSFITEDSFARLLARLVKDEARRDEIKKALHPYLFPELADDGSPATGSGETP